MQNKKIRQITFTGVFAALIFLSTWALHVPAGLNGGYVHFGDALIYLSAAILPPPFAILSAAIGAGLSDLMTPGAAVWVLPTVIIKSLCCLPFTNKNAQLLCKRNIAGMFLSGLITMIGYGIATMIIAGSFAVALAEIPLSFIQASGSALCFAVLAAALDKSQIHKMIQVEGKQP